MNSEKVKEIKKALEYAIDMGLVIGKNTMFVDIKLADILTLINELESENEALQKGVKRLKKRYKETITKNADECVKKFCETTMYKEQEKLVNENQQLKDRIAELEKENDELKVDLKNSIDMQKQMLDGFKTATKEVEENLAKEIPNLLKQFADRLKEDLEHHHGNYGDLSYSECEHIVDETLKEFVNE